MPISQSYIAYRDEAVTVVRGSIDREILLESADAAEALQAALDRLETQGGGALLVEVGGYEIARTLRVPSQVTVRGRGRATILRSNSRSEAQAVLSAREGDMIVIADLVCQAASSGGASAGVHLDGCGDSELRSVHCTGFGDYGILVENGCFLVRVVSATTSGNGKAGILVRRCAGGGRGGDFVPNLLLGCVSYGERGHGIHLDHTICCNVVGCVAYQPVGHGIYLNNTSNSTCVTGCRVFESMTSGVRAENTHELNVSSNIFCWNRGHGIELDHVIWATVSANNIIDNGGVEGPASHGIYLHTDTKSVQVTGNAVFNWQGHLPMRSGVCETDDCRNNAVVANNINYVTEAAIACRGTGSLDSANVVHEPDYPHPEIEPFVRHEAPHRAREFTRDRIEAYIDQAGR